MTEKKPEDLFSAKGFYRPGSFPEDIAARTGKDVFFAGRTHRLDDPSGTPHILGMMGQPETRSESAVTREEIDAKLERTEAKVEATVSEMKAEFATFRSDISTRISEMNANISMLQNTLPSKGFLVITAISIVAVIVAILALDATQFGNGIMASSSSVSQAVNAEKLAADAQRISAENAAQLKAISNNLDAIAAKFEAMQPGQAPQQ